MEKFAKVSFNLLVSIAYNIVIVPPGKRACIQVSRFPMLCQKPAEKPSQLKEQNKICKQFAWAKETAAHKVLAIKFRTKS